MIDTPDSFSVECENTPGAAEKAMRDTAEVVAVAEPENALPELKLTDLPVVLQEACARASWGELMPVQSRALPYLLGRGGAQILFLQEAAPKGRPLSAPQEAARLSRFAVARALRDGL